MLAVSAGEFGPATQTTDDCENEFSGERRQAERSQQGKPVTGSSRMMGAAEIIKAAATTYAPLSPRKRRAGDRFHQRKAARAPGSAHARGAAPMPRASAVTPRPTALKTPRPPARPSWPSMRLTALRQATVRTRKATAPRPGLPAPRTPAVMSAAMAACPIGLLKVGVDDVHEPLGIVEAIRRNLPIRLVGLAIKRLVSKLHLTAELGGRPRRFEIS